MQLTGAYRSLSRPSSPPDAKASTVCPLYLDQRIPIALQVSVTSHRSSQDNRRFSRKNQEDAFPAVSYAIVKDRMPGLQSRQIRRNSAPADNKSYTLSLHRYWIYGSGGDNRDRTGNLRRARAALSQLSYIPEPDPIRSIVWWAYLDLNQRPHAYQACALTT